MPCKKPVNGSVSKKVKHPEQQMKDKAVPKENKNSPEDRYVLSEEIAKAMRNTISAELVPPSTETFDEQVTIIFCVMTS